MQSRQKTPPDALDYFPTPPWAARAGGELVKRLDPDARTCWEPACGEGHMAHGLEDYFAVVLASDVFDYGFGDVLDFLSDDADDCEVVDWIITNPPFIAGAQFVRLAMRRARRGVAILARSAFLESAERYPLFSNAAGFAMHAQFVERAPMVKGRWDPGAASATAYSWFLWLKPELQAQRGLDGFDTHLGFHIPPGTKARLSRASDLARFCGEPAEPVEGDLPWQPV